MKSNQFATWLVALFAMFLAAPVASAQHNPKRVFESNPSSPTAMRNCGADLEAFKASKYTRRHVATGTEVLEWIKGCKNGKVFYDRHPHPVAAGTVMYVAADGKSVVFEGCINEGALKQPIPPAEPDIEPTPEPVPQVGTVCINKVQLSTTGGPLVDPSGRMQPVESFLFSIAGVAKPVDQNGRVCFDNIPVGQHVVTEQYDPAKWRNISSTPGRATVQVFSNQTTTVEFKNMNIVAPPPPPPPTLGCEFVPGGSLEREGVTMRITGNSTPSSISLRLIQGSLEMKRDLPADTREITVRKSDIPSNFASGNVRMEMDVDGQRNACSGDMGYFKDAPILPPPPPPVTTTVEPPSKKKWPWYLWCIPHDKGSWWHPVACGAVAFGAYTAIDRMTGEAIQAIKTDNPTIPPGPGLPVGGTPKPPIPPN